MEDGEGTPDRDGLAPAGGVRHRILRWTRLALGAEVRFLLLPRRRSWPGFALRVGQGAVLSFRRYRQDAGGDRAAALAFTTMLSMLPLLLMALAVLGILGTSPERMAGVQKWLLSNFVPETAQELQHTIESSLGTLSKQAGRLGIMGVVLLGLTGWKLLATLDRTFEALWGAEKSRRWRRIGGLWATVLVTPILVGLSLLVTGWMGTLLSTLAPGTLAPRAGIILAMVPGWLALFLAYLWCAGRRVPRRAAALGALASAVLWECLKVGFALYIRRAFLTKTVLAGMGVLPIFLLWIYLSWVVFILGAEVTLVSEDYDAALRRSGIDPALRAVP